jgi:hypothetical protein
MCGVIAFTTGKHTISSSSKLLSSPLSITQKDGGMKDYKPTNLIHVVTKIISKALAMRLRPEMN